MKILKYILFNLVFALIYFAAAKLGLSLATVNSSASPVWPATGLAIAILVLGGQKMWPAIAIGAFAANFLTPSPLVTILFITIGNTLEALVGSYIFNKFSKKSPQFLENQSVTVGIIAASLIATSLSASFGVLALIYSNSLVWAEAGNVWRTWWVGDLLGALVVAPLLIAFGSSSKSFKIPKVSLSQVFLIIVSIGTLYSITQIIFFSSNGHRFLFLVFPTILLFLVVYGQLGAHVLTLFICAMSVVFTVHNNGPFSGGNLNHNLINLQLFLAAVAVTTLTMIGFKKSGSLRLPGIVLTLSWALSGTLFYLFHENQAAKDQTYLNNIILESEINIKSRMSSYENTLLSGVSLIGSSNRRLKVNEWASFLSLLKIDQRHPGIKGLGTIWPVSHQDLIKYESKIKSEGILDFQIHPLPNHDSLAEAGKKFGNHYIVTFIEPLKSSLSARGLDIGTEPNRRLAAELARDTGVPHITSKITLIQDYTQRPGFLLYYPMYQIGKPIDTVEKRRSFFKGWVYAPFVADEFFKGLLGKYSDQVDLYVFEGNNTTSEALVFESGTKSNTATTKKFDLTTKIELSKRNFSLGWKKSNNFISSFDTTTAWVGFCGALVSLLLGMIVVILESVGRRARVIADKKTHQLEEHEMKMLSSARLSSLGEMAAGIAHEINNPLAIISVKTRSVSSEVILNFANKGKILSDLEKIDQTVFRIAKIIKGLRAFSRDGSKEPFSLIQLSVILNDTLGLCAERFKTSGVELRISKIPPIEIECRGIQISQVLINLLNNSFDAVRNQNEKWVEVVIKAQNDNWLTIKVTDSGPGISIEIQDKIMEPFFTTKDIGKGTGLGLSITKGLIEDHNGKFFVSRESIRTCFVVQLPILQSTEQKGAA